MAFTAETMPIRPANSQRYESPSTIGPGTMLTPTRRFEEVGPSMTNAAVPNEAFREASLTARAWSWEIDWAMYKVLSGTRHLDVAQCEGSGY